MEKPTNSVEVCSFNKLISNGALTLKLDDYQRGFVWDQMRVRQLVDDLLDYARAQSLSEGKEGPRYTYYMGTVLLNLEGEEHDAKKPATFVIDGQQRLAALSLIWRATRENENFPLAMGFRYRDQQSRRNIKAAYATIKTTIKDRLSEHQMRSLAKNLFENVALTVVSTTSIDEAFTFFDSQNSRGIPLHTTDLLKAHHLRAIRSHAPEDSGRVEPIQRDSAKRWEGMQQAQHTDRLPAGEDPVHRLFNYYLWRGRNWFGHLREPLYPSRSALQKTFKHEAYPPHELEKHLKGRFPEAASGNEERHQAEDRIDRVPCFPSTARVHHSVIIWESHQQDWEMEVNLPSLGTAPHNLPFTLRQPIADGAGFFLYAERYASLLAAMEAPLEEEPRMGKRSGDDWIDFRVLYQKVVSVLSHYLRQAFLLASMLYIDRFGTFRLYEFALWLEYILGAERLKKLSIFQASSRSVLDRTDGENEGIGNFLDFIAFNEIPDPVIRALREDQKAYKALEEAIPEEFNHSSVRGRYIRAVRRYFRGEDQPEAKMPEGPENRYNWVKEMLNPQGVSHG